MAKFRDKMGIEDEDDEEDEKNGKEEAEAKGQPKARVYEIYEAASLAKALQGLAKKGLEMDHYSAQDEPLFELVEGEAEKSNPNRTPIFSIAEILTGVKGVGKKGVQITRFKGLGEMDAKELFETTMNPEKRQLLKVDLVDAAKADEISLPPSEIRKRFLIFHKETEKTHIQPNKKTTLFALI